MCLFPLGGMADKRAVRDVAQRLGLGVAEKPDSQDICFVPVRRLYRRRLRKMRPDALEPGEIVTADGRVVGSHDGIARYTVGRASGWATRRCWTGSGRSSSPPNPARRRIVVGPRGTGTRPVPLRDVNWLIRRPTRRPSLRGEAAGARGAAARGGAESRHGATDGDLDEPALPAPGQACVFYCGDRVLGGGIITRGWTPARRWMRCADMAAVMTRRRRAHAARTLDST